MQHRARVITACAIVAAVVAAGGSAAALSLGYAAQRRKGELAPVPIAPARRPTPLPRARA